MPVHRSGSLTIDYAEAGAGPAVLLIHSGGSGNRQWRRVLEYLASDFHVLAPNLLGYGGTSPWLATRPQRIADQVQIIAALAEHVQGHLHLVGHSLGGLVSMEAALGMEERVASMVLLEPNPFDLLRTHGRLEAWQEIAGLWEVVRPLGAQGDWDGVAEHFADYWNAPGSWSAMSADRRRVLLDMLPTNYHEWDAVMGATPPVEAYSALAGRTLLVAARNTKRPIREIAEILRANLPGLTFLELDEGGHMAPLTRPDLVNPIVGEFLKRHPRSP